VLLVAMVATALLPLYWALGAAFVACASFILVRGYSEATKKPATVLSLVPEPAEVSSTATGSFWPLAPISASDAMTYDAMADNAMADSVTALNVRESGTADEDALIAGIADDIPDNVIPLERPKYTLQQALNPATPPEILAEIAAQAPHLRPQVAENPATYPALLNWLASLNDIDVDLALQRRPMAA